MEVVDDGRVVALGSGTRARLLTRLLLRPGEVVSRDRLVDALWGERPPATAANALQVQVHSLRKRLGQDRIVTEGTGYRLRIEPGELDLERFERLVARGRVELAAGDAGTAADVLREALSLWRGPALADMAYEPFAQDEIGRLEELRLVALENRIDADLALARHEELASELESLAAAHPLRERLQGQLMLALYRSGRQADALETYRNARRALVEELGLEPGPELRELEAAILRQDAALRVEPPALRARRHLPAPATPLVGRRREIEEVGALLRGGARLLTLTGPGGTGKTRLAVQAAHELADAFPDGVHFVDLAHLRDPALVPSSIARVLGVDEQGREPVGATLTGRLRDRRLLLLLDNFEVVDEAAPFLGELLTEAPDLALLVTSRTPLRLSGEHEYRVPPLPLEDAARLFAVRARAVAPRFRRPSEEAPASEVAEICRRLDCLPLPIELAAARTREYSPAEMLELLPSRLELAGDGARDLPRRQRTLRATIDWSYERLAPDEQALFAALAVFAGGCTAAAVESVCAEGRGALASLVAKSLLRERPDSEGAPRYLMLETIREYADERLRESGRTGEVRQRHAEHFLRWAEARYEARLAAELIGHYAPEGEEHENVRAALAWMREAGENELELRLARAMQFHWGSSGYLSEGRAALEDALSRGTGAPPLVRARAMAAAATLAWRQADEASARRLAEAAMPVLEQHGDRLGVASVLHTLGIAAGWRHDYETQAQLQAQAEAIFRELGNERGLAYTLGNRGYAAIIFGDYERAESLLRESLSLLDPDDYLAAIQLLNVGLACLLQGRLAEARSAFRQALERGRHERETVFYALEGLANVAAAEQDVLRAARLWSASVGMRERVGAKLMGAEQELHDRAVPAARARAGVEAFDRAWTEGELLSEEQAVALGLDES